MVLSCSSDNLVDPRPLAVIHLLPTTRAFVIQYCTIAAVECRPCFLFILAIMAHSFRNDQSQLSGKFIAEKLTHPGHITPIRSTPSTEMRLNGVFVPFPVQLKRFWLRPCSIRFATPLTVRIHVTKRHGGSMFGKDVMCVKDAIRQFALQIEQCALPFAGRNGIVRMRRQVEIRMSTGHDEIECCSCVCVRLFAILT